jgi:hypothetical protein
MCHRRVRRPTQSVIAMGLVPLGRRGMRTLPGGDAFDELAQSGGSAAGSERHHRPWPRTSATDLDLRLRKYTVEVVLAQRAGERITPA